MKLVLKAAPGWLPPKIASPWGSTDATPVTMQ
ncbi:Uncharacterised protein [Mycobacteroides abscessus subsp. abscessus]|nr:Uncharacterised protein [Mycobacteroides abscessus subsp. abscessus]